MPRAVCPDFTGAQCRAARALRRVSQTGLAIKAGVPLEAVIKFEDDQRLPAAQRAAICQTLHERVAVKPISETSRAGTGVRLRFPEAARRERLKAKFLQDAVDPAFRAWIRRR